MGAVPAVRQGRTVQKRLGRRCCPCLCGGSVGSAPGGARSGPGRNSAGRMPRRRACGTRCAPRIPRNHGSGGQQAALPGAGGLLGRKDGAEAKSFIHRKRGVHPVWMHAPAFPLCYRLRSSTYSSLGLLSSPCAAAGAAFWAGSSSSRMPSRQSKYFMAISGNRA